MRTVLSTDAGTVMSTGMDTDAAFNKTEESFLKEGPMDTAQTQQPAFSVVAGNPNAEELAALAAVVLAMDTHDGTESVRMPRLWARRHMLRGQFRPGPGAWRRGTH